MSKIIIFCSVFTAVPIAPSMYSIYSAHLCGKSLGLSAVCAAAGGALSQGLEAAAQLAFRGPSPPTPPSGGNWESQGQYIFGCGAPTQRGSLRTGTDSWFSNSFSPGKCFVG